MLRVLLHVLVLLLFQLVRLIQVQDKLLANLTYLVCGTLVVLVMYTMETNEIVRVLLDVIMTQHLVQVFETKQRVTLILAVLGLIHLNLVLDLMSIHVV